MPFAPAGLVALTQADGFTLWLYRTADSSLAVLGADYFDAASDRLASGDLVIVQAVDATTMVPIRSGAGAGAALTLDTVGAAVTLQRSAAQLFSFAVTATAERRAITLGPLPRLVTGDAFAPVATVLGAVANVAFRFTNAAGALVAPVQTVPVLAGLAVASFVAPVTGGGYRLRAADPTDAAVFAETAPFFVFSPPRLLRETGARLLTEQGASILL